MNEKKRGGARLAKSSPAKKPASASASEGRSGAGTPKRMNKGAKIALIILAVLLAAILIFLLWYKSWAKLPDLPDIPVAAELPTPDSVTGVTPSVDVQPVISDRKEGFYTFLLIGRDTGGGGNTDTLMLAAYDIPNQKLSVMSIPRDTMVNVHHQGSNHKINAVWNLGLHYADKNSTKTGPDYLKEAVGEMMGVVPDFHIVVKWEAFGRLVDAIGGVDFNVPFEMKYRDPTQNLVIDQAAGYRHLSGSDAMQVVRWRHNNSYSMQYVTGDLGRVQTQQALMKEIIKQCLQIKNITKIKEFAEIFADEVETNLTVGNLVAFAERAILGGLDMENVTFTTLPVTVTSVKGASYVKVKPEEMLALVNADFNPYKDDLTMENVFILHYSDSKGYYRYKGSGKPVEVVATPKPNSSAGAVSKRTPKPSSSQEPDASPSPKPASSGKPSSSKPSSGNSSNPGDDEPDVPPDGVDVDLGPPVAPPEPDPEPPTAPDPEPPADDNTPPQGIPLD